MTRCIHLALFAVAIQAGAWLARADEAPPRGEATPEQIEFFEKQVRPLLAEHCFKCHGPKQQKSGLRVDHVSGLLTGGDSGPALVPGKPDDSLLIDAVRYNSLEMPPDGKLSDAQIEVLARWVAIGAPWPATETAPAAGGAISDEDRQWWAFQPLRLPEPPAVADDGWSRNEIDRFVFQKLSQAGLRPAPEASRLTLARRVSFDLTGLPPTPDEARAFAEDVSPDAYERLVERLLASPEYGRRWARHWLDLVRYADSDGYRADDYRPNAWRYRDYVVAAFNHDKPYDRFVQEQLAGDELFPGNPEARTATGYLRCGIYEYNSRDVRGQWEIILNDLTDTTGDAFLGLGLQCARCHDHKYDPLLQKDYFRLRAFFAGLTPYDELPAATADQEARHAERLARWETQSAQVRRQIETLEAPFRERARHDAVKKFPDEIQAMIAKPANERTPLERQLADLAFRQVTYEWDRLDTKIKGEAKEQLAALRKSLAEFDALKPEPLPRVLAASEIGAVASETIIPKKGTAVEPGYLTLLDDQPAAVSPPASGQSTGRRAALAAWLTRPDHPLTARVMVNRVWQHHFCRGLAANASDFGKLGGLPSHPELLDWLACRFVADGWSVKQLHRQILLSATYRQSSAHPDAAVVMAKDPENRLYWRGTVRRLDAEQIRDALYAVTGELRRVAGGPGTTDATPCRSIFLRVMRNTRVPLLDVFDAPFWIASAASRDVTTTPLQALMLINSQFTLDRAAAFAQRLFDAAERDDARRVALAYQLAFGRGPTTAETAAALDFIRAQATAPCEPVGSEAKPAPSQPWVDFCHVLLNANEFLYVE
ncbi:MAG TPA: PSD1 and planctomycete cytochrome C domain-containing protein [Pirellulales bacterium]|nr:PSD1 and planctomycete cytochrome C domain-containing protein [Pirellulales bacterium]